MQRVSDIPRHLVDVGLHHEPQNAGDAHRRAICSTQGRVQAKRIGLAELVRRALQVLYGKSARENPQAVLQATAGAWRKRHESGEQYVEQLRPGLAERERHVG